MEKVKIWSVSLKEDQTEPYELKTCVDKEKSSIENFHWKVFYFASVLCKSKRTS